ncbi:hypothetical protein ACCO45_010275 [Purpureocillium lilacinum]|uniref:Uncharacterized protein n=1 Tax=Purpureocillium lilacinum TaxID=33203 RepID=A0ACC4DEC0_PURLI
MKAAIVALALCGLAAAVPDISKFPACAIPCVTEAAKSNGCADQSDAVCFCKPEAVAKTEAAAHDCVKKSCDPSQFPLIQKASDELCASVGKVLPPAGGQTSAVESTGAAAPTPTGSGAAHPTGTGAITATASQPAITAGANAGPVVGAVAAALAAAMAL